MTKVELEYDLMKSFMIRHIGWEADNCIIKAKQWAPKVIAAFPELFPNEKVPQMDPQLSQVTAEVLKHHPSNKLVDPGIKNTRSVGRRP